MARVAIDDRAEPIAAVLRHFHSGAGAVPVSQPSGRVINHIHPHGQLVFRRHVQRPRNGFTLHETFGGVSLVRMIPEDQAHPVHLRRVFKPLCEVVVGGGLPFGGLVGIAIVAAEAELVPAVQPHGDFHFRREDPVLACARQMFRVEFGNIRRGSAREDQDHFSCAQGGDGSLAVYVAGGDCALGGREVPHGNARQRHQVGEVFRERQLGLVLALATEHEDRSLSVAKREGFQRPCDLAIAAEHDRWERGGLASLRLQHFQLWP